MPRVVLSNGVLVPLDPIPPEWSDGRELYLDDCSSARPTGANGSAAGPDVVIEEPTEWMDDDDYRRLCDALEEADRIEKARMRREMGLPE